eukprot:361824-Chlamydomonas_euryale.AAC.3
MRAGGQLGPQTRRQGVHRRLQREWAVLRAGRGEAGDVARLRAWRAWGRGQGEGVARLRADKPTNLKPCFDIGLVGWAGGLDWVGLAGWLRDLGWWAGGLHWVGMEGGGRLIDLG